MTQTHITEKPIATLEQSLAMVHKGQKVIDMDLTPYKQPTLDGLVAKPFEHARDNKESALKLAEVIEQAIQLARESHLDPIDVEAALATQRPAQPEHEIVDEVAQTVELSSAFTPFGLLRDKASALMAAHLRPHETEPGQHGDRLDEAITVWREATAAQRRALELLGTAADGVYGEAELVLARRTSFQAGDTARAYQQRFSDRHALTQQHITTETTSIVGRMVETKQKEASLDAVKDLRNQLTPEYLKLTKYLEQQSHIEGQLHGDRDKELAAIETLEARSQELAQKIIELKHIEPDMTTDSFAVLDASEGDSELLDELLFAGEGEQAGEQTSATDRLILKKTRLVSVAEDELTDCNEQLAAHRASLQSIDAALRGMEEHILPHIQRETELRERIFDELVVPTLLATTPEVHAVHDTFRQMRARDNAKFRQLPKLMREYADAELWLNDEFIPRVVAQLKATEPERYTDLPTPAEATDGPITTAEVRRFMQSIGIVILNRKDTFSARIFNAAREYGTTIAQAAYDNANANVEDGRQMMLDSSSTAYTNAVLRKALVEQSDELGTDVTETIRALDHYVQAVEAAISASHVQLQAVGHSMRSERQYADELDVTLADYRDAQEATNVELARAEEVATTQRQLEAMQNTRIRQMAGLEEIAIDEEGAEPSSEDFHTSLQLSSAALSAGALAKSHAVLARKLNEQFWAQYEKLDVQSSMTAQLIADFYRTRADIVAALESGGEYTHDALASGYAKVEETIRIHENLPVPRALGEAEVHKHFLALNGRETLDPREKPLPVGRLEQLKQRGRMALSWVSRSTRK